MAGPLNLSEIIADLENRKALIDQAIVKLKQAQRGFAESGPIHTSDPQYVGAEPVTVQVIRKRG